MIELIKQLVNEGFKVRIIEVEPKEAITIATPVVELSKEKSSKVKSEEVVKTEKTKRINWKTIKKIKEAKEDGLTSGEAAKDLGLPLQTVNKYWV